MIDVTIMLDKPCEKLAVGEVSALVVAVRSSKPICAGRNDRMVLGGQFSEINTYLGDPVIESDP